MKEEYEEEDTPLPYKDFRSFSKYQSDTLKSETDDFLKRHNLRLKKYILPSELPPWAKSFDEVLDTGKEHEPLTTIYRHKHFLKARILHNWSYIETRWNRSKDPRNKNIPFDLRPLTTEILNQLDVVNEDMLDPEFSGLLVTLNTYSYIPEEEGTTAKTADSSADKTLDPSVERLHGDSVQNKHENLVQKNKEAVGNAVPGKVYTAMHNLQNARKYPAPAHSTMYMDMAIDKSLPVDVSIDINLEPIDDSLSVQMPVKNTYDLPKNTESHHDGMNAHHNDHNGMSSHHDGFVDPMNHDAKSTASIKTLETCDVSSTGSSDLDFILNSDASEETSEMIHGELKRVKFANSSTHRGSGHPDDVGGQGNPDGSTGVPSERHTDANTLHPESTAEASLESSDASAKHVKFVDHDEGKRESTGVENADGEKRKISKVIAGALVECLVTNERCIKCIWVHPALTKHSSRILLQAFLPRLMYEIFQVPSVVTSTGVSHYNKFAYAMHNDLDLFPRQCWLLLASAKKMSLPRHYEPSTFEEHPVDLEYGDCHTDEAGHLLLKEFEGVPSHNILNTVGSEVSARSVACNCRTEKLKKGLDDQAWLDRLVGCTESYMYLMLPKRKERARLGLLERDGWRDLIADAIDPILHSDILGILPEYARSLSLFSLDPNAPMMTIRSNANLNGDTEEWCRLRKEDLIDVTSDTEVYMRTDSDAPIEEEIRIKRRRKRWRQ